MLNEKITIKLEVSSSSNQLFQLFNNFCENKKEAQSEVRTKHPERFFVSIGKHLSESIRLAGSASRRSEKYSSCFVLGAQLKAGETCLIILILIILKLF